MLRILFVDDEVRVLEAMRRTFHPMKSEWSMEFVLSGAAALNRLAKSPANVIVSDIRMSGMVGGQLPGLLESLGLLTRLPQWWAAINALDSKQKAP